MACAEGWIAAAIRLWEKHRVSADHERACCDETDDGRTLNNGTLNPSSLDAVVTGSGNSFGVTLPTITWSTVGDTDNTGVYICKPKATGSATVTKN